MSAITFSDDTATRMVKGELTTRNRIGNGIGQTFGFLDVQAAIVERVAADPQRVIDDVEWVEQQRAQWRAAGRLAREHGER